jgi:hypothetical protein
MPPPHSTTATLDWDEPSRSASRSSVFTAMMQVPGSTAIFSPAIP